jgi:pSer/pThr/pTyr-binding forkhead associated (FHA) protein
MDDMPPPGAANGLPAPRLHCVDAEGPAPPLADFVPLRLLLQPGGLCVELTKPDNLVGRHSEADVRLALPDVSRRHCRFLFTDGAWQVTDLNSLNGIFVNEERLQEATLAHGDHVRIASLTFLVEIAAPTATLMHRPEDEARASVLKSIASVLPGPGETRKAS